MASHFGWAHWPTMDETQFFELPDGMTAFGTKRFDRKNEQRVHVHSLAGMVHVNFKMPSLGYTEFKRATRRLTRHKGFY